MLMGAAFDRLLAGFDALTGASVIRNDTSMPDKPSSPDFDSLMSFLANTPRHELKKLAEQQSGLEKYLISEYPSKPWGNIAPDTQEAQDAATADGERDDEAEKKIYSLLEHDSETWTAILTAIANVAVDDGALAFFRRYHKPFSMDEPDDGDET